MKTTNLIHDLEMRRDSFLRLQEEGNGTKKARFVTFEDMQNMEQVQKWTTSKVGPLTRNKNKIQVDKI